MIDIQQAVYEILTLAKVAPVIRPITAATLDVRPILTYQVTATENFETFSGSASWKRVSFALDVFADDYATATGIIANCVTALHNYSGTIKDIQIGISKHKEDTDMTEPPDIGQEKSIVRVSSTYSILYRKTS